MSIQLFTQTTPGEYSIKNLKANSSKSDFGPAYWQKNKLIFASSRGSGLINKKWEGNKQPFLDLYIAKINDNGSLSNVKDLSGEVNSKYHESSVSFSPDYKYVYFTRDNELNENFNELDSVQENSKPKKRIRGQAQKDKKNKIVKIEKQINLAIFKADVTKDGDWVNIRKLPFNSPDYSVGHPAVDRDGKKLYFTSDMPGSYGGTDIFVVDILDNDNYSTPKNLGRKINTLGNEMFPFVDTKNILYFASNNRKEGVGGLDIFAVRIYDNDVLSQVLHLGFPINTEYDDFAMIVDNDIDEGYFSSNRKNGKGDDDIYHFTASPPLNIECEQPLTGIVKDSKTNKIIKGATVQLIDLKSNREINTVKTNGKGFYKLFVPCDGEYNIVANKEGYESNEKEFNTPNSPGNGIKIGINLNPVIICKQKFEAIVRNSKTGKPISNANVVILDNDDKEVFKTKSSSNGKIKTKLFCDKNYKVKASKKKYESNEEYFVTKGEDKTLKLELNLKPIIICKQEIVGIVKNTKNTRFLKGALVKITDDNGREVFKTKTNKDGKFYTFLKCEKNFTALASKNDYENAKKEFITTKKPKQTLELLLKRKIDSTEIKVLKDKIIVNIDPIYFDLNSDKITKSAAIELDKVVDIMKKYPKLKIEGGSHTDSRGGDAFNIKLSTRRAESTVNYIIRRGIDPNRITAKGYGETQPVNRCVNGVRCSESEHQQNRRTEFVILNPEVLEY
jgi:outer membrane protein OmpA-like peptidoglycan-associated protein/transcriptional antiterminator Rof (Rho-off)